MHSCSREGRCSERNHPKAPAPRMHARALQDVANKQKSPTRPASSLHVGLLHHGGAAGLTPYKFHSCRVFFLHCLLDVGEHLGQI